MKITNYRFLFLLILNFIIFSCNNPSKEHPRILLKKGEEKAIKNQIKTTETWAKMHQTIMDESEAILEMEPGDPVKIGRRLLSTTKEYLRRIFDLCYAYRMTGDERFMKHAEAHMLKAASFEDWNPSHFLDVADMTMALAIGYDWLYSDLSEESRQIIREAIVKKGIEPSFNDDYNWFLDAEHNWNQVCNAGMTYGALAIKEDYPELADSVINRAFESIPKAMIDYQPDGAYPEGYNYWGYGTTFNILFLSAVETYFGTDRGLTETPGFLKTGEFMENMLTPSFKCCNWSDCGSDGSFKLAMFWFADRNNDPSLLFMENKFLQTDDYSKFTKDRVLPALMIWGKDIPFDEIKEPDYKIWVGQGKNPVALMRTSWTDPDAIFLGFKTGSPSVNHGHMDIGSFIMEAGGIRWAMDFGAQSYESLESKGMRIFGRSQDAQRWTVFRLNNYSHSVLTINDELQRVDGYAKIDKYSDDNKFLNAVSDISSVYNGQLKKATRGVSIVDNSYVVIQDEVATLDNPTKIRWNLVTPAEVELNKKAALLRKDGKVLFMKVNGSEKIKMKTWSTSPTNDYDAENPGTIMVGFECELPANSEEIFQVLLIPEEALGKATFPEKSLADW